MPILKKKNNKKTVAPKNENIKESSTNLRDLTWVLKRARITEKAALSAEKKVYVFEIASDATKKDVFLAVKEFYKVVPIKVNISKVPSKKVTRRKKSGTVSGYKNGIKKANIYLKKEDKIDIV